MATRLVGRVKGDYFTVRLHRRWVNNSFGPVLYGSVYRARDGTTRVDGEFRLAWFARVFVTIWFGGVLLFAVIAVPTGIIGLLAGDWAQAMFLVIPVVMVVGATGMLHVAWQDTERVADRVAEAVAGTQWPGGSPPKGVSRNSFTP